MLCFSATRHERGIIDELVTEFCKNRDGISRFGLAMDMEACHSSGCPLDLQAMYDAVFPTHTEQTGSVWHDIVGIRAHINRGTGRLEHGFMPRFHLKPPSSAPGRSSKTNESL